MQVAIKVPIETVLLVAGDKETGEGKACSEPTREKDRREWVCDCESERAGWYNEAKEGRYIAFRGDQVEGNDGQTDEVKQESQWTITL